MNGFDRLAPIYDTLSNLAFGRSMVNAQTFFLDRIQVGDRVLILGGGTGWLLEALLRQQPDCEVWYVESSSRMIDLAKQKCKFSTRVHFILGTQQAIPPMVFDVVIMNFFLDLFLEDTISPLLERIKAVTKPEGAWLVTDFEKEDKAWQHIALTIMIAFFRLVCAIEATKLPDLKTILAKHKMQEIASRTFFRGFIKTALYRKT